MNDKLLDREQVELAERMAIVHLVDECIQLLRWERQVYNRLLEDSLQPPNTLLSKYVVGDALPSN